MKRRNFIKLAGVGTLTSPLLTVGYPVLKLNGRTTSHGFDLTLVKANDLLVPTYLESQNNNAGNGNYGGQPDQFGIYNAGGTARFIEILACAYLHPASVYYQAEELIDPLTRAAQFMLRIQHDDGTIDLHTTNFHSTPDTAFVLEHICATYGILLNEHAIQGTSLLESLKTFIQKGGDALSKGGIHTPNHRWVVCMALSRIHGLFPDQRYLKRIDEWLQEKIDIDPDGQFTEKSTTIYSPLTDRCLITIARLTGKTDLYDPVRKNLEMTFYYVHPDGEVVTEASRRQDKYTQGSMAPYFYPYRFMALLDKNGQFAAMTRWIQDTGRDMLVNNLVYYMEDPLLKYDLPAEKPLPVNYCKTFIHSHLVRIRRENVSATILAQNFTFFSFHKGPAALESMRFTSAFFGKGQFTSNSLVFDEQRYILSQQLFGPYYQPFPVEKLPQDGDWEKMVRSLRPQSEIQELNAFVFIKEISNFFEVVIDIRGTDGVPVAIEMGFRHGGKLSGVREITNIPETYLLENGFGEYTYQDSVIRFGPGAAAHTWTQLRGALPKLDAMSVYITGFTPFYQRIRIS